MPPAGESIDGMDQDGTRDNAEDTSLPESYELSFSEGNINDKDGVDD
jgi:hypothetical protein